MHPESFGPGSTTCRYFPANSESDGGGLYGHEFRIPPPSYILSSGLIAGGPGPAAGFMSDSFCGSSSSSSPLSNLCQRYDAISDIAAAEAAAEASPDEKTLIALRNHKEAEKRRRERINSHLDRLRSLLPCSSKTDKATLLAKVVQRVRELNQEASEVVTHLQQQQQQNDHHHLLTVPSQNDEYSVDHENYYYDDDDNNSGEKLILKASLCCEDRSDLLSDLIEVVNSLNLKTLRAEMLSLGGRAANVLILSGDRHRAEEYVALLHEALKSIVQRSGGPGGGGERLKRRRRLDLPQAC